MLLKKRLKRKKPNALVKKEQKRERESSNISVDVTDTLNSLSFFLRPINHGILCYVALIS